MKKFLAFLCFLIIFVFCFKASAEEKTNQVDDLIDELEQEEYQTTSNNQESIINDPLYPVNYAIFVFNDNLYEYIVTPVSNGYKKVCPKPVRSSLGNFFSNLSSPLRIVNNLLQFKFKNAGKEFTSFAFNSTFGAFGFFKPSDNYPALKVHKEDFGQTLASYGIGEGCYIVLPFYGPSTLRDGVGKVGDFFVDYPYIIANQDIADTNTTVGIAALDTINGLPATIEVYNELKKISVSPYEAMRNAYIQNRRKEISK